MPEIDPAIAALALWCRHRDDPGPTRTQAETIFYGPDFEALPLPEKTGCVAHHVLHVALRHSARAAAMAARQAEGFDADLFNMAADALINEALLSARHILQRPVLIACDLVADAAQGGDVLSVWDTERLYLAALAQNTPAEDQTQRAVKRNVRTFTPDLEREESNSEQNEDIWAGRVQEALAAGKQAGSGIGAGLAQFADLPRTSTPWEIVLRRLLLKAVSDIPLPNTKRPSSRWIATSADARARGAPEPVFQAGRSRILDRPRLIIAIDTSSSVTESQLNLFAAEAVSITRSRGAETHLVGFDTEIHHNAILADHNDLTALTFRRDGGTSFAPVMALANKLKPSLLLVLTDLDAPLGDAPAAPVIWGVPDAPGIAPAYGQVLVMTR